MAGFLSLLSNEVSAFIICVITLDRFIVLRFPFSRVRLKHTSTLITCLFIWLTGVLLAALPLTPMTSHWRFYEQTGVCIPLPITRTNVQTYSFAIMIVLNFVLFVFIALGQVAIVLTVYSSSKALDKSKSKPMDMKLARRLMSIVVTDFLCWFPVGLLGLLAWRGMAVPGEVNVAVVTFVMPLNSALNPFLYTLNVVMEKRKEKSWKAKVGIIESRIRQQLEEQFKSQETNVYQVQT